MGNYKVIFKDNQPVEAILIEGVYTDTRMELKKDNDQTSIDAFFIDAKSKEEALDLVEKIMTILYGENMDASSY